MKLIKCTGVTTLAAISKKQKRSGYICSIGLDSTLDITLGCTFTEKYYTFAIYKYNVSFIPQENYVKMRFKRTSINDSIEEICEKVIECYNSIY